MSAAAAVEASLWHPDADAWAAPFRAWAEAVTTQTAAFGGMVAMLVAEWIGAAWRLRRANTDIAIDRSLTNRQWAALERETRRSLWRAGVDLKRWTRLLDDELRRRAKRGDRSAEAHAEALANLPPPPPFPPAPWPWKRAEADAAVSQDHPAAPDAELRGGSGMADGTWLMADGTWLMADGSGPMADGSGLMADGSGLMAESVEGWREAESVDGPTMRHQPCPMSHAKLSKPKSDKTLRMDDPSTDTYILSASASPGPIGAECRPGAGAAGQSSPETPEPPDPGPEKRVAGPAMGFAPGSPDRKVRAEQPPNAPARPAPGAPPSGGELGCRTRTARPDAARRSRQLSRRRAEALRPYSSPARPTSVT